MFVDSKINKIAQSSNGSKSKERVRPVYKLHSTIIDKCHKLADLFKNTDKEVINCAWGNYERFCSKYYLNKVKKHGRSPCCYILIIINEASFEENV